MTVEYSDVDYHHGNVLLLIANTYTTVHRALLENIQNCIDATATRVNVIIDFSKREIYVRDNGDGVTKPFFEKCIGSVGLSMKQGSQNEKFGRFGLGAMSPVGKCRFFTFISTPRSNSQSYIKWTFDTKELQAQEKRLRVPNEKVPELRFGEQPRDVAWRTEVHWVGVTADQRTSTIDLDKLEGDILDRYGKRMLANKVEVVITMIDVERQYHTRKVVAKPYTGILISRHIIPNKEAGGTHFEMYRARKTARGMRGVLHIGQNNDPFRMSFKDFLASPGVVIDDTVAEALSSGVFEGEIRTTRATLHQSRTCFIDNDALVGLCEAIVEWYQKHGAPHYEEVTEGYADRRHQQIGLRVMKDLDRFLQSEDGGAFQDVIDSFALGTRSSPGDADKDRGLQVDTTLTIRSANEPTVKPEDHDAGSGERKPERVPPAVRGPRGRRRHLIKGEKSRLTLAIEPLRRHDHIWELDHQQGVLIINSMHALFAACEHSDKALVLYIKQVLANAMTMQALPAGVHVECAQQQFEDAMRPLVFLWINDQSLTRGPGRPPKDASQIRTLSRARSVH